MVSTIYWKQKFILTSNSIKFVKLIRTKHPGDSWTATPNVLCMTPLFGAVRIRSSWQNRQQSHLVRAYVMNYLSRPSPQAQVLTCDNHCANRPGNSMYKSAALQVRVYMIEIIIVTCKEKVCIAQWVFKLQVSQLRYYTYKHLKLQIWGSSRPRANPLSFNLSKNKYQNRSLRRKNQ